MEASHEGEAAGSTGEEVGAPRSYVFEVLASDGGNRAYLIADPASQQAALVDPLYERIDEYLERLRAQRFQLAYTIETHTHADHLSGSPRLRSLTGARMLMHASSPVACVDRGLSDGDVIELGALRIGVMDTPGHTSDSLCLVLPDRVLTGDTLLIGSCGRTDLPTGDPEALYRSLQRLLTLPDGTGVFPAHDYNHQTGSTIGRERKLNPRLKLPTADAFCQTMRELGLPKPANFSDVIATNQRCLD
jgi:glyoxylase-like metal-dependent hydrolase (beta-lactamase superfamily II)